MQLARSEERLKIEIFSDHWTLEKEDKAMKTRSKNKVDPDPTQLHGFQGIIGSIFSRLEMRDLMNCRLVCRTFYNFLSVERSPWVDLLKNYVAEYSEVLKTEKIRKEDEWRSKKMISDDWKSFLALLYKDGELDDLMLVSHKFMKVLGEKKELIHLKISKVFCCKNVFQSIGYFEELKFFQLLNRLKFPYNNMHSHNLIDTVFSAAFINQLDKEGFNTFIDCFKEMTIEQFDNEDESPEVGYGWVTFEFYHALAIMMHTKDTYKVKHFLELKDMEDEYCDDWDCNNKKTFPPLLRFAFELKNLEIFKMVTNYLETDFNEKISEMTYPRFNEYDEKLRGFYPLHAAAKLSNYEIFEYVYSKATCKCPEMYTRDQETVLPYHLAGGKRFREKLEKLYYKEICSVKPEDRKRRLVPYVPPIVSTSDEDSMDSDQCNIM